MPAEVITVISHTFNNSIIHSSRNLAFFENLNAFRPKLELSVSDMMYFVVCYRYDITQLLLYLWGRIDCRESILRYATSRRFVLFLGAIFDTLLYQLNDSLTRLMNIHKMEQEKESGELRLLCRAVAILGVS